ncbi:MAG TPA: alpha/beta hydrolase [Candidatus Competibacteraceae bacterium]|nr:alpha/beta hydrolase [Candidatus Competibacteraceae bacterium]
MPELELLSRLPQQDSGRTPLLFLHGAFSAAWCWDEHFLPYFAAHGYPAYAVSLRGHGGSEGHERLLSTRLQDYVADLMRTITALPRPPVLVGHSMGGMVIQKYLERHSVPGAVLMASVPPQGLLWSSAWMACQDPWLYQQLNLLLWGGPRFASPQLLRRAIFSPTSPEWQVARYFRRMQRESQQVALDMSWLDLPGRPLEPCPPLLVLGAEGDVLVPPLMVEATARRFGTRAEIFPDMAHAMMLERGWQRVAEHIRTWLQRLGL